MKIIVHEYEYVDVMRFLKKSAHNVQSGKHGKNKEGSEYIEVEFFADPQKPGPKAHIDQDAIISERAAGKSYAQIAASVGCSRSYVQKVVQQNK